MAAIDVEIQDHPVPLGRQLAAGFAPRNRRDAWLWLIFAALGFLAGQIIASIFVVISAALTGNTHNISAVSRLNVPPEWYVASTLLGLWMGLTHIRHKRTGWWLLAVGVILPVVLGILT